MSWDANACWPEARDAVAGRSPCPRPTITVANEDFEDNQYEVAISAENYIPRCYLFWSSLIFEIISLYPRCVDYENRI